MRTLITLLAGAAALVSAPAMAQLGGRVGGAVGGAIGAPPAMPAMPPLPPVAPVPQTVPAVPQVSPAVTATTNTNASVNAATRVDSTPAVDAASKAVTRTENVGARAVNRTQKVADRTTGKLSDSSLTLVTSDQVTTGLVVRDQRGQRIGTVSSVSGNTALVVSGNRTYSVPLTDLYTSTTGNANGLVSSVPRAQLTGKVNAKASAKSAVSTGN
ncbi:MAG: hypothetical protein ACKOOL_08300 [Novosphingobium sp.]